MAVYLVHMYSGLVNEEIGRLFGELHYSALRKVEGRVREAMARVRGLVKIVRKLDSHFKA